MSSENINYSELFEKIDSIKKILLIAVGRAGSDFFHSLLDSHSQILHIPGSWNFHEFWQKSMCKDNLDDLIQEFIWSTTSSRHIVMFKSKYHLVERWDQLGKNKNESFEVDVDVFSRHLKTILLNKKLNSRNFFIAVHLAYGLASGLDIEKVVVLFYNIHHINKIPSFKKDFQEFDVIATIRYPINTITSSVNNYLKNKPATSMAISLGKILARIFEETENIYQYTEDITVLKLEDLSLYPDNVQHYFCNKYGLNFEGTLLEPTFGGKKWWGDMVSGKYLDGFNNKIEEDKGDGNFFIYDRLMIEGILSKRMEYYSYSPKYNISNSKIMLFMIAFIIILPMRLELRVFWFNLKKSSTPKDILLSCVFACLFYLKRVGISYKYLLKALKANFKYPRIMGDELAK